MGLKQQMDDAFEKFERISNQLCFLEEEYDKETSDKLKLISDERGETPFLSYIDGYIEVTHDYPWFMLEFSFNVDDVVLSDAELIKKYQYTGHKVKRGHKIKKY